MPEPDAARSAADPGPRSAAELDDPAGAAGAADPATRSQAVQLALAAYETLFALAETVEEEWSYVTALADFGRQRIRSAESADEGRAASLPAHRGRSIRLAAAEIQAITDPHRAIDWLSTFPAVVELTLAPTPAPAPGRT